jgi:hypothetical protein
MVEIKERNEELVAAKSLIKDQIKHLAKTIKQSKLELKESQRAFSGVQVLNMPYHSGREKVDREFGTYSDVCKMQSRVLSYKDAFRVNHIVASMIRGKRIKQIESNPKMDSHQSYIYMQARMKLKELGIEWRA